MDVVQRGEEHHCNEKSSFSSASPLPLIFLAMKEFHRRHNNDRALLEGSGGTVMSPVPSFQGRADTDANGNGNTTLVSEETDRSLEEHGRQSKSLDLSNGDLTRELMDTLQCDMLKMDRLTHFSITDMTMANVEQSKDIQRLLVEVWHQQQLFIRCVNLSNCGLDDEIALQFASRIAKSSCRLDSLILSGNKISDVGASALAVALSSRQCHLRELDLSDNRLSPAGVLSFCEHIDSYQHLRVLRLNDGEQLLPVSIYQQFAAKIEKNHVLRTLTMGSEIMDGSVDPVTNRAEKEMDALLRYFWQEPAYTAITDHIRNLLRLNCSGLDTFLDSNDTNPETLRSILDAVEKKHEADACYRILQLKPDLIS